MELNNFKIDLKIFKIDKNYFELREKSVDEIIETIKENHIKKLRHKFKDIDLTKTVDPQVTKYKDDDFLYWSYCFNQPKEKFYWKVFLPEGLTENQDFNIIEFSYVLFIKYKDELYCIISGSGINVIKKYLNPSFGIQIYQRLCEPMMDNIIEVYTRSIANNISSKKETYNLNQTISETLDYSNIPTKIKLKVRDELKKTIFKKYDLNTNLVIMEVGAYFYLRKKIDFEELKELIKDLYKIEDELEQKQLTLFSKVNNYDLEKSLDNYLLELVVNDVLVHVDKSTANNNLNDIIELVHPTQLERFYECDKFIIRYKNSRGKSDLEVFDRGDLYYNATKYIYETQEDINNRQQIVQDIYKLNISGQVNNNQKTYANFISHITAEIDYQGYKYFKIDGHWYLLEDEFLSRMNEDAKSYYNKYMLEKDILNVWNKGDDEDTYNKSHEDLDGYYILDKVINENIELCDILTIQDDIAYFIHVKNGFNTKMRDLYIQVVLAAKRLSNDLKNNNGISYLEKTLIEYNKRQPLNKIDIKGFIEKIKTKKLNITFVMAFRNNHYLNKNIIDRIDLCKSNIAKYSLVQVVKEMQEYDFSIKLIDISDIKNE
ncbi:DUF6119 family protein [Myroides odoratimimus]|uniref:DUF6119 family protein n=1 Tax=Myroides odoratimimus TaxID=76832 RepID=UPI002DBF3FFF|nr:DUF6119 family protein [Myroides odoratimimus]MEC4054232.1 DUF6119 family protein [Myroides odoratimimus]